MRRGLILLALMACGDPALEPVDDPEPTPEATPGAFDPEFIEAAQGYIPDLPAEDVAAGDVDGDGDTDLVVVTAQGGHVLLNSGLGAFAEDPAFLVPPWGGDMRRVVLEDFDGDGRLDAFTCHGRKEADRLLRGVPGGFEAADDLLPLHASNCRDAVAADLDADGDLDLALLGKDDDAEGAPRTWIAVLRWDGGFTLEDGAVAADLLGLPVPGVSTSPDATLLFHQAGGFDLGRLEWSGGPSAAAVTFPLRTPLTPRSLRVEVEAASVENIVVVAEDASGERFRSELPYSSLLDVTLADGAPSGGDEDGIITPPVASISIRLQLADGAPSEGAAVLRPLVLATLDGGAVVLESFARPDRPTQAASGEEGLLAHDVDRDGALDLIVSRVSGSGPALRLLLRRDGWVEDSGRFPAGIDDLSVSTLAPLDLDAPYLYAVVRDGQDRALLDDGTGRFFDDTVAVAPVEAGDGRDVVAADLDRDGRDELIVANHGGADRILHPDGDRLVDWTARAPIELDASTNVVALDIEGDGDLDLVTFGPGRPPRLLIATPR